MKIPVMSTAIRRHISKARRVDAVSMKNTWRDEKITVGICAWKRE